MKLISNVVNVYHTINKRLFIIRHSGDDLEFTEKDFKNSVLLPSNEKKKLRDEFFYFLILYISNVRKIKANAHLLSVFFQFTVIIIGNWNLTEDLNYFNTHLWTNVILWYTGILLCVSVVIFFYYYYFSSSIRSNKKNETKILSFLSIATLLCSCFFATGRIFFLSLSHINSLAISVLLLVLLIWALSFFLFFLEVLSRVLLTKWLNSYEPRIAYSLFTTLSYLSIFKEYPTDVQYKRHAIMALERLAMELQEGVYVSNKTSNLAFNSWLNEYAKKIANTIRGKQKDILVDNKAILETQEYLSKVLFNYLTGQWSKIANSKNITVSQETGVKNVVMQISKNLLVGIIPLVSVFIFDYFIKIPENIRGYVFFGILMWLIINLLLSIDPTIGEKLRVTKDLMSIAEGRK